jgi:hypothetical protein
MAGFYELATGLQAPILGILRAKQPVVSGGHLKNSRFWEIAAGDWVRSALPGRSGSAFDRNLQPSVRGIGQMNFAASKGASSCQITWAKPRA